MKTVQQAYRKAPWKRQTQMIVNILAICVICAFVIMVYLSISADLTRMKLDIQNLHEERSQLSKLIADSITEQGRLTAFRVMEVRAKNAGFITLDLENEDQVIMLPLRGYSGFSSGEQDYSYRKIAPLNYLMRPEYTETLQQWFVRKLAEGF